MEKLQFDLFLSKHLKENFMDVLSDTDPGEKLGSELEKREQIYTALVSNYSEITNTRNILKEIHKWLFFWLIIIAGFVVAKLAYNIINKVLSFEDDQLFLNSVPIIITAFVSFISIVISIPLTITQFLFNKEEDENITQTIKHTQDHDSTEITLLKDRYVGNKQNHNGAACSQDNIECDSDQ